MKFANRRRYDKGSSSCYESGSTKEMVTMVAESVEEMRDRYLAMLG